MIDGDGTSFLSGLRAQHHSPTLTVADDVWIAEVSAKALWRIWDEGIGGVLVLCPAHWVIGQACVHTILAWSSPAIDSEVARVKQPNVLAVFYSTAGVATMRVIGGIGIQRIRVM